MTISSVQSDGFGDGRAFKAQCQCGGNTISIAYLFQVHNLLAIVDYVGAASAGDTQTRAVAFARKQEAKLFAAFAPPPEPTRTAAPPPAPIATAAPTSAPTPIQMTAPEPTPAPTPPSAPYCAAGEQPQFRFRFATLKSQLGPRMGNPTSCVYSDPGGSGDTLQTTDTGLAIYRGGSGIATFTNGSEHWALAGSEVVEWTGDSVDPPNSAEPFAG